MDNDLFAISNPHFFKMLVNRQICQPVCFFVLVSRDMMDGELVE
jgi:hypothetical protein